MNFVKIKAFMPRMFREKRTNMRLVARHYRRNTLGLSYIYNAINEISHGHNA